VKQHPARRATPARTYTLRVVRDVRGSSPNGRSTTRAAPAGSTRATWTRPG